MVLGGVCMCFTSFIGGDILKCIYTYVFINYTWDFVKFFAFKYFLLDTRVC